MGGLVAAQLVSLRSTAQGGGGAGGWGTGEKLTRRWRLALGLAEHGSHSGNEDAQLNRIQYQAFRTVF